MVIKYPRTNLEVVACLIPLYSSPSTLPMSEFYFEGVGNCFLVSNDGINFLDINTECFQPSRLEEPHTFKQD